ncbi:MupA/Atu3671 family FMN-dependent luciferase-like monooxygenase [Streptomyces sp. BBFR2]|uniref:MupA/Atu3671 family FMN-dependent luciferase-like monooxygenase n=1 Tax=Streptomyces sp. BBFR2 TaxID=3372854 RepID=UPI0037DA2EB4
MDFSLFYFANDSGTDGSGYELLLEGAKFADQNDFTAVWTPERHFHPFGGTYPNPSVTGAAIAAVTERIGIRAGSVVAGLHHPLRIAEEWAVVDNISGGRAGISLASGWHAADFCFNPSAYESRKTGLFDQADTVRRLWRGEELQVTDGTGGPATVRSYPRPVQPELPVWITSGGDPRTVEETGRRGHGLLTHLLGQDLDQLAAKITAYRKAVADRPDADGRPGHVAVMVHAFLGEDDDAIRETVRRPLSAYLRSSLGLLLGSGLGSARKVDPSQLRERDIDFLVARAFDRYYDDGGLLGDVDKALRVVRRLKDIGVDEVACLIDFGVPTDQVLAGLTHLDRLRRLSQHDGENS